jgi:dTDP-4-dehydrorhamnose reductase
VDALETRPDFAKAVNEVAPGIIAQEGNRLGATLVHFSTDYVFDGQKATPYSETDTPNPLSVYGRSKLDGENAIRASTDRFVIIRTSWVYGSHGRNFFTAMKSRGRDGNRIAVVDDQRGSPTWSKAIAEACVELGRRIQSRGVQTGIYHLTSEGCCSWYAFAVAIRDGLVRKGYPWRASLAPTSSAEYGLPARRPANSQLSNQKWRTEFGSQLNDWRKDLTLMLEEDGSD